MLAAWERLYGTDEDPHGAHQARHGGVLMVAGDGVMQCLPQPLDDIDPGAIGRLEHEFFRRFDELYRASPGKYAFELWHLTIVVRRL